MGADAFYFGKFKPWKHGQVLYDGYNAFYFGNALPVVYVGFYRMSDDTYGYTFRFRGAKYTTHICLNPKFKGYQTLLAKILLHEMVHVKLNNKYGHGPRFKRELKRLILAGAFDDLL